MTKSERVANFIANVEIIRVEKDLTQAQMAEKLEMSVSGYKKMISGETQKVDINVALQLSMMSGMFVEELCGEMHDAIRIGKKIKKLGQTQQAFVESVVDFEVAMKVLPQEGDDCITVFVPTGNLVDGMHWDSANFEMLNISAYRSRIGKNIDCGIKITSDHLYPAYHNGDILLVNLQPPRDGDVGIFINKIDGRVYIRTFCQGKPCELKPINSYGVPIQMNTENEEEFNHWILFGHVVTKMR